jgi:hypothetical protein
MAGSRPERNYHIEVTHPVLLGGEGHAPAELDLSPGRPDYVTTDGAEVWIEHKRQKTRFLDSHGNQVGPIHPKPRADDRLGPDAGVGVQPR